MTQPNNQSFPVLIFGCMTHRVSATNSHEFDLPFRTNSWQKNESRKTLPNNRSVIKKIIKIYKLAALHTFNTIILLLIINLALAGLLEIRARFFVPSYREKFSDIDAYSAISPADATQYLDEQNAMGSIGLQYTPWTQFRNPAVQGMFLNTNRYGFRKTREPRPAAGSPTRIFVFGGSTTFGYGVPDEHTIPSYMQTILESTYPNQAFIVKNYGQGFYYSSQEMLLLISAIKAGDIPDVAVFIDGGNDTYQLSLQHDQPYFTNSAEVLWDSHNQHDKDYSWIPMIYVGSKVLQRLSPSALNERKVGSDGDFKKNSDRSADYVVNRYKDNVKMIRAICEAYHIRCYFVWQPVPFFKYDRSLHRAFPYPEEIPAFWGDVYRTMQNYSSPDFLYLGDLLEHATEKIFVDDVHYNEKYNEKIAMRICNFLRFEQN